MKPHIIFTVALAIAAFSSCKKDDKPPVPGSASDGLYITSGGGFSGIIDLYFIAGGAIYGDSVVTAVGQKMLKKTPMSDAKYQIAKPIIENFPAYLLQHPDTAFRCMSCADFPTLEFERVANGDTTRWMMDLNANTLPPAIRDYVFQTRSILNELEK